MDHSKDTFPPIPAEDWLTPEGTANPGSTELTKQFAFAVEKSLNNGNS